MDNFVARKTRIQSIDILRGAIMLIMALDHVRDFLHIGGQMVDPTDMRTTYPVLFFTRWITHFCAPIFVFLSGISAYLAGTRRTKQQLLGFLVKRGVWLVFVELVIITLAFSLNPLYNAFALQVIWAIGMSMILLGLLIWLPARVIGLIGLILIFGHDIITNLKPLPNTTEDVLIKVLFTAKGTIFFLDKSHIIFDLYAILPWTGVMLLGYFFGTVYKNEYSAANRKTILLYSSLTALVLFITLRLINQYGDPAPWATQKNSIYTFMSFLNVSKYPPSLMYCCLTLSAGLFVLALTEKAVNKLAAFLKVYGSVPFFYYVLHFYLIRFLNVIVFFAMGFKTSQIITPNTPFLFQPPGFGFNLASVYVVWLIVILLLYFPCRWFSNYKKTHTQWWLSYL
ncbi:DUF1624 domain-containing protein [Mucilaginibacter pallidiroseus]|uniref:DUF1624 domain-containing protein n=1 Tax=Mucilaginibacter pallidiroseus TaxID=2599295 RepID=A0A563U4W4_9SPHI|nr:heparan-alpha-glucosaminide N-acetyltransferase domain-containing protein [Mucilaginibacter pallidiroseus]TWR26379.1 DUF1624 domain-containing protein [Mucilaginibacter pallidiroseus]